MRDPEKIKKQVHAVLADESNDVIVSAASTWEIAIKTAIGKLLLPEANPAKYVMRRLDEMGLRAIPISPEHALAVATLPLHHADPFDRMLIAQARAGSMFIVTSDPMFKKYDVQLLDACGAVT